MSGARAVPARRSAYRAFRTITTRWADNDLYGHMNNVVHYSLFDTAVNGFLIDNGALDLSAGTEVFLVVETGCRYHAAIAFPDVVTVGLAVSKLGSSSVRYEIGLFRGEDDLAAAEGFFVHVNVDRRSHRPVPFSDGVRRTLAPLAGAGKA